MIQALCEGALLALGSALTGRRRQVAFRRWLRTDVGRSSWWAVAAR